MNKSARILTLAAVWVLTIASTAFSQDTVRIGVWNIEKLSETAQRGFPELRGSQSLNPRTDSDLDKMAEYIKDELAVDALMVTEVEADSPLSTHSVPQSAQLNHVALKLGSNWKYFLGQTGGKLRLGFLFNTDRIKLKKLINLHASEFHVTGRDVLDRDPFIAWISVVDDMGQTKNDVMLVCVHLKSIQDRFRNNRMAAMAKLVGDLTDTKTRAALQLPSKHEEREVLILGDCNDSSFDDTGFKYMFDYLAGTGFAHVKPTGSDYPDTRVNGSKIDHIFATSEFLTDTMEPGSFKVHTVPDSQRAAYRKTFSDHFPVTVALRVQSDGDRTLDEALLVADDSERGALLAELTEELRALTEIDRSGLDDEEDAAPPIVSFDLIDRDFDRILAPQPQRVDEGATEPVDAIPDGMAVIAPPRSSNPAAHHTAIWTAIDLIQEHVSSLVDSGQGLSANDAKRLGQLLNAQRELLKSVRPEE